MSTAAQVEGRRTAIAIVRADLEGDRDGFLTILSGTEDVGEVLTALVALTGELVQVLGKEKWRELLDRLAIAAALDE